MDLLLAFYQSIASSPFHDLNAIFVTDSLGPFALFSVSFQEVYLFLVFPAPWGSGLSMCRLFSTPGHT